MNARDRDQEPDSDVTVGLVTGTTSRTADFNGRDPLALHVERFGDRFAVRVTRSEEPEADPEERTVVFEDRDLSRDFFEPTAGVETGGDMYGSEVIGGELPGFPAAGPTLNRVRLLISIALKSGQDLDVIADFGSLDDLDPDAERRWLRQIILTLEDVPHGQDQEGGV